SETYFSLLGLFSFCDDHPHLCQLQPGSNNTDEPEVKTCVQEGINDGDCLAETSVYKGQYAALGTWSDFIVAAANSSRGDNL
ncbi:hypothetical protein LINPERHAP1_LOCUS343, partial [Linum perenne]